MRRGVKGVIAAGVLTLATVVAVSVPEPADAKKLSACEPSFEGRTVTVRCYSAVKSKTDKRFVAAKAVCIWTDGTTITRWGDAVGGMPSKSTARCPREEGWVLDEDESGYELRKSK